MSNDTLVNSSTPGQLIAAQLSQAAYTSLAYYATGSIIPLTNTEWLDTSTSPPTIRPLPPGWHVDLNPSQSFSSGINQFVTFVNTTTHQVVITFKGTDNWHQTVSDVTNDGATQYAQIQAQATAALNLIKNGNSSGPLQKSRRGNFTESSL